jgi:hypothetical protein
MESKIFINTKTGKWETQIPLMEIADYIEMDETCVMCERHEPHQDH